MEQHLQVGFGANRQNRQKKSQPFLIGKKEHIRNPVEGVLFTICITSLPISCSISSMPRVLLFDKTPLFEAFKCNEVLSAAKRS